ncbi:rhomboid-like protein [Nocardia spumae]|uniref:rhomboid-like protein n=1 Tax=Nocardia spumae TaxID=2887190 RepID=UPI001D136FC3|nr:rhomboid-like protein [Nocardia spumae]
MASSALNHYRSPWTRTIDVAAARRQLSEWWHGPDRVYRAGRAVHDHLAGAPAACAYAFTLFVTWWTLRGISDFAGHRLILSASTNLHNMRRDPVQVLVASAFWTDGGFPWSIIIGFLTVGAFAERWLGTLRWIMVFACGHAGASMIVVTGIAYAVHHQLIPLHIAVASDVGSSYGSTAILAVLTYHLRGTPRAVWAAALLAWFCFAAWHGRTFTDYGHLTALLIGFVVGAIAVALSVRLERARDLRAAAPAPHPPVTPPADAEQPSAGGGRSEPTLR